MKKKKNYLYVFFKYEFFCPFSFYALQENNFFFFEEKKYNTLIGRLEIKERGEI